MVECQLPKLKVASSSLVTRSSLPLRKTAASCSSCRPFVLANKDGLSRKIFASRFDKIERFYEYY